MTVNPIYLDPTYFPSDREIDGLIVELQEEIQAVVAATQVVTASFNGLLPIIMRRRAFTRSYPLARSCYPIPRRVRGASSGRSGIGLPLNSSNPRASLASRHARGALIGQTRAPSALDILAHVAASRITPSNGVASSSTNTLDSQRAVPHTRGDRRREYTEPDPPSPESLSELEFEEHFDILNYVLNPPSSSYPLL
ncbi:hypothetical protein BDN72DRAFT_904704 [Pluteus cervinus]|uniref:Uncharacterized protein n=1 Tax=Pluteus cervinus TaxID=181527 RepID=A0ACD3A516_9AGAR|nr:hypothetical protein BDN72DRAFT_904704 [Pluteus cervinus]